MKIYNRRYRILFVNYLRLRYIALEYLPFGYRGLINQSKMFICDTFWVVVHNWQQLSSGGSLSMQAEGLWHRKAGMPCMEASSCTGLDIYFERHQLMPWPRWESGTNSASLSDGTSGNVQRKGIDLNSLLPRRRERAKASAVYIYQDLFLQNS